MTKTDTEHLAKIVESLELFGRDSGLYEHLCAKSIGSGEGSPFEIRVTLGGKEFNLVDVGYGVSQSLPLVVEAVLDGSGKTMLFQQPEVHLHPRAQAALGSFFARMTANHGAKFVIETHSDYLIDRVRREVAAKTIAPSQVGILFFDNSDNCVTVHPIGLDEMGNVMGAPQSYRSFFLNEELAILSRGDADVSDN